MAAQIVTFVSRAQQLQIRGSRNYGRWLMLTEGHVAAGSICCCGCQSPR
jgi:hypothetical protein